MSQASAHIDIEAVGELLLEALEYYGQYLAAELGANRSGFSDTDDDSERASFLSEAEAYEEALSQVAQARAFVKGFAETATREVPDFHDVATHRSAWRSAIEKLPRPTCYCPAQGCDCGHESYVQHELRAFDRTFDALEKYLGLAKPALGVFDES